MSLVCSLVSTCLANFPRSSATSSGCARLSISSDGSPSSARSVSSRATLPAKNVKTRPSVTSSLNVSAPFSSTISIAFAFFDERGMFNSRFRADRSSSSVLARSSFTSSGRSLWKTDAWSTPSFNTVSAKLLAPHPILPMLLCGATPCPAQVAPITNADRIIARFSQLKSLGVPISRYTRNRSGMSFVECTRWPRADPHCIYIARLTISKMKLPYRFATAPVSGGVILLQSSECRVFQV